MLHSATRGVLCTFGLLTACATTHVQPDAAPPPGPVPCESAPPEVRMITPDGISNIEVWDASLWGRTEVYQPVLAVGLTSFLPHREDGACLSLTAEVQSAVDCAVLGGLSMWRLRDGSRVETTGHVGLVGVDGSEVPGRQDYSGYSIVPESFASLEPGWYLLRADLSALGAIENVGFRVAERQQREGDVLYARFYKGSRPMWRTARAECDDAECRIYVTTTERLSAELTGDISVSYDGDEVPCTPAGGSPYVVGVVCPRPAEDGTRVGVDFITEQLVSIAGDPLSAADGVSVDVELQQREGESFQAPELGLDLARGTP